MSGAFGLFVKTDSVETLRPRVPSFIDIEINPPSGFAMLKNNDEWGPLAAQLARDGFESVMLGYQSSVDAFFFVHTLPGGAQSRVLQFGWSRDEGTWETVAGAREPWEQWELEPRAGEQASIDASVEANRVVDHYRLFGQTRAEINAFVASSDAPKKKKKPAAKNKKKKPARKKAARRKR